MDQGKTLLVDGPASIILLSGEVEILGAPIEPNIKMVIRKGKRVPFEVKQRAELDLTLGENATVNEAEASTIPTPWESAANTVLSHEKPVVVMVMGDVDLGKTSFCTYLANKALKETLQVVIIDADLGQSDVGPPTTIGSCRVYKPIRDLFEMGAENICFVGVTSPSGAARKVIEALTNIRKKALVNGSDVLIINTDGWVEGEDAVRYKVVLTERISPNIVIGIQEQNELAPILNALQKIKTVTIQPSSAVKKRDREGRKLLRELSYKKYLKGAKTETFPLSWIKIADAQFGTGVSTSKERLIKIQEELGATPKYCEEKPNSLFIVLGKGQRTDKELVKELEKTLDKKVKVMSEGDEQGLLVALHDKNECFLGIGVLEAIDYERRLVKVYTRVKNNVSSIHTGRINLDKTGKEIGLSETFVDYASSDL